MATTLTSTITQVNIPKLKRDLEVLGDVFVVSVTPPNGAIPTTVVLTRGDKVSNLTSAKQTAAQTVINSHVDDFDEAARLTARKKVVIGTIEDGTIDFSNDGTAWRIDSNKNLVPVGTGRTIGTPDNPVSAVYALNISSTPSSVPTASTSIFNEVPQGAIDGVNVTFTLVNNFQVNSTRVYVNGLRIAINPTTGYLESGQNQITFSSPPEPGDEIIIDYVKFS